MHPRAASLIRELQLRPHPEGGWFRRIETSPQTVTRDGRERPAYTCIHYLLAADQVSQWHRIDADETWHLLEGGPLTLRLFDVATRSHRRVRLRRDAADESRMYTVPAGLWQSASVAGEYALSSCKVTPGFVWQGFELLAPDHPLAEILQGH